MKAIKVGKHYKAKDLLRQHGYLTTEDVQRALNLSPRVVQRMFDDGRLEGYRVDAGRKTDDPCRRCQPRRYTLESVQRIAKQWGIKLPADLDPDARVLLFACPGQIRVAAKRAISDSILTDTDCPIEFGATIGDSGNCQLVVIGSKIGVGQSVAAAKLIRQRHPDCKIVLILGDDGYGLEQLQEVGNLVATEDSSEIVEMINQVAKKTGAKK